MAFTPTAVGSRKEAYCDCSGVVRLRPISLGTYLVVARLTRLQEIQLEQAEETYGNFTLSLTTMRHRMPVPLLKDRVFPVLQMTCSVLDTHASEGSTGRREKPEFLVVSITVDDLHSSKSSFGNAASSRGGEHNDAVVAAYVSVERIRKLSPTPQNDTSGGGGGGCGKIEWIMATASDARGVLPIWVQTRAVPGEIAKDVGFFLGWIAREREVAKGERR